MGGILDILSQMGVRDVYNKTELSAVFAACNVQFETTPALNEMRQHGQHPALSMLRSHRAPTKKPTKRCNHLVMGSASALRACFGPFGSAMATRPTSGIMLRDASRYQY